MKTILLFFLCNITLLSVADTIPKYAPFKGEVFQYKASKKDEIKNDEAYTPYAVATVIITNQKGEVIVDTVTNSVGRFIVLLPLDQIGKEGFIITVPGKTISHNNKGYKGKVRYHTSALQWYDPSLPVKIHVRKTGGIKRKVGFLKRRRKIIYNGIVDK